MSALSSSRLGLVWTAVAILAVVMARVGARQTPALGDDDVAAFIRDTARAWQVRHGAGADLQVAVIDVSYRADSDLFAKGEGVVVTPVGIDLAGAQELLEVAARPPFVRRIPAEGITTLAWAYAGRLRRPMRFVALALVRRPQRREVELPARPGFESLARVDRFDALLRATQKEEHRLEACADFSKWARETAGAPPHTEQLARLVRHLGQRVGASSADDPRDDICEAARTGRLNAHRAQVLAVMAAREVGVPAFGFASTSSEERHLVGTFVDGLGWLLLDVEAPDKGYALGGAPLLTKVPLAGPFEAADHGFWYPDAGAYSNQRYGGLQSFSSTGPPGDEPRTDTTAVRSLSLEEAAR